MIRNENRFVHALRTSLLKGLFSFLLPDSFSGICSCSDLYNLLKCSSETKTIMMLEFIKIIEFRVSSLSVLKKNKLKYVRRVYIDDIGKIGKLTSLPNVTHLTLNGLFDPHLLENMLPKK